MLKVTCCVHVTIKQAVTHRPVAKGLQEPPASFFVAAQQPQKWYSGMEHNFLYSIQAVCVCNSRRPGLLMGLASFVLNMAEFS